MVDDLPSVTFIPSQWLRASSQSFSSRLTKSRPLNRVVDAVEREFGVEIGGDFPTRIDSDAHTALHHERANVFHTPA